MTPRHDPTTPTPPDELGPDLLAHVRGELDAARKREIEALLDASAELRAERDALEAALADWSRAGAGDVPRAERRVLEEILATIADEAAERRARAAAASPDVADAADAVALALGQCGEPERERVARLVAADAQLTEAARVTRLLATATRSALALEPRPETLPALLGRIAETAPTPVQFDSQDIPAPSHATPRRLRFLRWLAPLAAAAVIVIALQPPHRGGARVSEGTAFVRTRDDGSGARRNGEWIDAADGPFDFAYGDVLRSGAGALTVRVACGANGDAPPDDGPLPAGAAEFVLEPGAMLARVDAAHFELLTGRVRVTAEKLTERLDLRSGALYVAVTGTRFDAAAVDGRLFVIVERGSVRLGRRGPHADAVSVEAGEQGMASAERLVRGPLDGRVNGDAFLTPRALLRGPRGPLVSDAPLELRATLVAGDGGPVTIAGFDASVPLFLVRLKGPNGRAHEVKIQESMLTTPAPTDSGSGRRDSGWAAAGSAGGGAWRLSAAHPYELDLRIDGLDLEPGLWEARLRYMSYRARPAASTDAGEPGSGIPWLGAVESAPITFEVTPK